MVFIVFNLTFNACMLYVFKYGSATLAMVAGAVRVALSAFLFQFKFVAGPGQQNVTWFHGVAVVTLILGLVVYKLRKEKERVVERPVVEKEIDDMSA